MPSTTSKAREDVAREKVAGAIETEYDKLSLDGGPGDAAYERMAEAAIDALRQVEAEAARVDDAASTKTIGRLASEPWPQP